MEEPMRRIKGLGEIALRVADLDAMQRFYQEVVGLEVMRRADNAVFFRIGRPGPSPSGGPCSAGCRVPGHAPPPPAPGTRR